MEASQRRGLSKSKLLSWLQCPKRLWLEVHKPEVALHSAGAERLFALGHSVGQAAQDLHPGGVLVGSQDDLREALAVTATQIEARTPVLFEPTFQFGGLLVRADILKRTSSGTYELREVKASASVKDYQVTDAAIQGWVLEGAGIPLDSIWLQYIDTKYVYQGNGDYRGLFAERCVDTEVRPLTKDIPQWILHAQDTLAGGEPERATGKHCQEPFDCSCFAYCSAAEPQTDYPLHILPHLGKALAQLMSEGHKDVRDIPVGRLTNATQERVRRVSASGTWELESTAREVLAQLGYPRYYLDFETIGFAVPIWAGTRPYQQVPFQWSCHVETARGVLQHRSFLDTSGDAPMEGFVESLLNVIGDVGPVFAYNAGFEKGCLEQLATILPQHAIPLGRLKDRFVDLLALTRGSYYHPAMKGSWSLKAVLPTVAPELSYATVGEVHDGGEAQSAYIQAISATTTAARKAELRAALERYCERDTLGLVRLSRFLQEPPHAFPVA